MTLLYVGNLNSVHVQRWVRFFAGQGHQVHVLTPALTGSPAPGIHVHVRRSVRTGLRPLDYAANAALLAWRVFRFRVLVKQIRPDLVHAHYLNDAALIAALAGSRPFVATAWGSDVLINRKSLLLRTMLAVILRKADLVTCDAAHMKRALVALGADAAKVAIIYFGTDTIVFHPSKRDPELRAQLGLDGAPVVISIRSLEPVYDVGTLIEAFPAVLGRCPSAKLVIGGTGSEEAKLRAAVQALGIAHAVRFAGWISQHELPRYLASCDVYVSTALSDAGIAASTAEAMACALPVIVTDVGDNREWVEDGMHGFVVPARDRSLLAARISALLEDGAARARLGGNARELIDARNNWTTEMGRMEEWYREVTAPARSSQRVGGARGARGA